MIWTGVISCNSVLFFFFTIYVFALISETFLDPAIQMWPKKQSCLLICYIVHNTIIDFYGCRCAPMLLKHVLANLMLASNSATICNIYFLLTCFHYWLVWQFINCSAHRNVPKFQLQVPNFFPSETYWRFRGWNKGRFVIFAWKINKRISNIKNVALKTGFIYCQLKNQLTGFNKQ